MDHKPEVGGGEGEGEGEGKEEDDGVLWTRRMDLMNRRWKTIQPDDPSPFYHRNIKIKNIIINR